ncbi:hypothetical protein SCP_1200060 [Sparassis crispa]|uniref:Uncharacterized protein n=1 Tax=Sparassis crispa TaxID=139825 RepID=A0A401H054_9APHY|nr:hypothetical protein SCP_1200060 [Sparassis crispa]GBE87782.1 hypothetical protein SCP_1200060 [Sparassis crispa]
MLHNDHSQIPVLRQGLDVSAFYNTWRVFMEWSEITTIDHLSVPCIRGTIQHDASNPRYVAFIYPACCCQADNANPSPSVPDFAVHATPSEFRKVGRKYVSVSPVQCPKSSTETDVASTSRPPSLDTRMSLLEEIEDLKREQQKLMQLILILEKEVKTMELRVEQSGRRAVHVREYAEATADLAALVHAERGSLSTPPPPPYGAYVDQNPIDDTCIHYSQVPELLAGGIGFAVRVMYLAQY